MFVCVARRDHQSGPPGFTFSEADEDDAEFRLVDSRTTTRSKMSKTRQRGGNRPGGGGFRTYGSSFVPQRQGQPQRGGRQAYNRGGFQQRGGRGGQGGRPGGHQGYGSRRMGDSRRFDASINVNPEWGDPVETWEFSKLTKLRESVQFPTEEDSSVLLECGKVGYFNYDFSKSASTKQPKTLARNYATEKTFLKVTSSEDPNLRRFANEGTGNVFITDTMLSALMAMPRALYSWDMVITKNGDQIWFDRRSSKFDAITVNENSSEPPDNTETDPLNTPNRLSAEAVACQQNFSQQVLVKDKTYSLPFTSPFSTDSNASTLAPVGYRYVSLPVGDKYTVIVRADIEAVKAVKGGVENVSVKTLNEYDAKVTGDWRKKMEVQRGGVVATELKNNMFKIQRWALQALFAGAPTIEIGYVSRQQPKDAAVHHILSVQSYTPQEFFTGMNVNLNQMWSIIELILDRISSEEDGKYLLYKEAAVPNVKLYKIPSTSVVVTEAAPEASSSTGGLTVLK